MIEERRGRNRFHLPRSRDETYTLHFMLYSALRTPSRRDKVRRVRGSLGRKVLMPQVPHYLVQIHKSEAGYLHYTLLLTLRSQS